MVNKLFRRRRVFRLVAFLAAIGIVFICFQIWSIQILNKSSDSSGNSRLVPRIRPIHDISSLPGKPDCWLNPILCAVPHNTSKAVIQNQNKTLYLQESINEASIHRVPIKQDNFKLAEDVIRKDSESFENYNDPDEDNRYVFRKQDDEDDMPLKENVELQENVVDGSNLPRGVPTFLAKQYMPDDLEQFICLQTMEKLSWSRVNDDYCDCQDSSDEPGTSACPKSKFYCKFQLPGAAKEQKWVTGSKVNDGLCDCCDVSDEWQNLVLPDRMLLHDGAVHYGIRQAPCFNTCGELVAQARQMSDIQRIGAGIKHQYVKSLASSHHDKLYGKDGAYLMLAEECFQRTADKYKYEVCPFRHVHQDGTRRNDFFRTADKYKYEVCPFRHVHQDGTCFLRTADKYKYEVCPFRHVHQDGTNIGRNGSWMSPNKLKMAGGDSPQCPGVRRRTTFMEFECGTENVILSIQEVEVCEYTIKFSTPAAC